MYSLTKSQKADPSPCAAEEKLKKEKSKKDKENDDLLKFLISEMLLEIMIFCFAKIAIKTQSEKIKTLMIVLSTIVFLIAVIMWIFFEIKNSK